MAIWPVVVLNAMKAQRKIKEGVRDTLSGVPNRRNNLNAADRKKKKEKCMKYT